MHKLCNMARTVCLLQARACYSPTALEVSWPSQPNGKSNAEGMNRKSSSHRTQSPSLGLAPSNSVEARLNNIEESLSKLTSAVQSLSDSINSKTKQAGSTQDNDRRSDAASLSPDSANPPTPYENVIEDETGTPCYIGNSSASSFLDQAPKNLDQLNGIYTTQQESLTAASGLVNLSQAYAAMGFEDEVRKELRNRRRESELFYVPEQSEGIELMRSRPLLFPYCPPVWI